MTASGPADGMTLTPLRLGGVFEGTAQKVGNANPARRSGAGASSLTVSVPPLATTPTTAAQDYPAGHPGASNAAATVLSSFHGNDSSFTATSAGLTGVERSFISFSSAVRVSRSWIKVVASPPCPFD